MQVLVVLVVVVVLNDNLEAQEHQVKVTMVVLVLLVEDLELVVEVVVRVLLELLQHTHPLVLGVTEVMDYKVQSQAQLLTMQVAVAVVKETLLHLLQVD